jgi:hypothetical protein
MATRLSRNELYELVWSEPMKNLSVRFGISDVALKKTCARAAIPTPDRGYWAKREAGKSTFQQTLSERPPGMDDTVVVGGGGNHWYQLSSNDELLAPLPSPPVFQESIETVRERIAKLIGKVSVRREVHDWHPAIDRLLKDDDKRRERQLASPYPTSWDAPRFDGPLERRMLRILNALFLGIAGMNGKPVMSGQDLGSLQVTFFQQHVGIRLGRIKQVRRGGSAVRPNAADDNKLSFSILESSYGSDKERLSWQDDDSNKIEARIAEIARELVVTAEVQHRESALRHYQWRVERKAVLEEEERKRKLEAERRERERVKRLEQGRIDRLLKDAAAFQQAAAIRKYVEAIQLTQGCSGVATADDLERWSKWALAQADRIDPAIGGSFLKAMRDEDNAEPMKTLAENLSV